MCAPDTAAQPQRPQLALRVGVTGLRSLPSTPRPNDTVAVQIRALLLRVKQQAEALAADPRLSDVYVADPDGVLRPQLRLLSPLAEGADRLVAEIALDLGYRLEAVLPFAAKDYRPDFNLPTRDAADNQASLAQFDALLAAAGPRVLALDGRHGEDASASYAAIGRLVVRNCDLLVAVWDGLPGKGSGGTLDTLRFATRCGPPVWWIEVTGVAEPAWIETLHALRRPETLDRGSAAEAKLAGYLDALLVPPAPPRVQGEGFLGRLLHRAEPPLPRFLCERPLPNSGFSGWLWRLEARAMPLAERAGHVLEPRLAAAAIWLRRLFRCPVDPAEPPGHAAALPPPDAPPPPTAAAAYWDGVFDAPDRLAVGYAARYRSSYIMVAGLAALALFAGIGAIVWAAAKPLLTGLELVVLAALIWVVVRNQRKHWHERLIAYRLLAELCRMQRALALFGGSLPLGETWRVARGGQGASDGRIGRAAERDAWVGWYFHAALRAAPLPQGELAGAALEASREAVLATLIQPQLRYHTVRRGQAHGRSRGLAGLGEVLLLTTTGLVLLKLALLPWHSEVGHAVAVVFGVLAVLAAVPSAAFIALRAYAELEVLAEGSAAMAAMMAAAEARLRGLPQGPVLVSQEIGSVLYAVAVDMLEETEGWARLFKVKGVEAG